MTGRTRAVLATLFAVLAVVATPAVAAAQQDQQTEIGHAEEECIKILEDGGEIDDCQEAPNPILPATNELIWGSLAFLVLLVLLWKFGLPPVRAMMKAREDKIRNDLEAAEHARTEAEAEGAQYRAQLGDARSEANRIVEEARQAAEQVRRDLIARAEADAAEIRSRAQDDIRFAQERAMSDIQRQVAEQVFVAAERIVEHNLDRDTQLALVESYIRSVGNGHS